MDTFNLERTRLNKHQLKSERTRSNIMDAAEPMFAQQSLAGVSMRQIAAAAGVDLSLVLYHFESKAALYRAVISRVMRDFTQRRAELLDALEAANPTARALELFDLQITAWFDIRFGPAPHRTRLILLRNRIDIDAEGETKWPGDDFAKRFVEALVRAEANRDPAYVHWAYHCLIGSMVHLMTSGDRIDRISDGLCDTRSPDAMRAALLQQVANSFPQPQGAARG